MPHGDMFFGGSARKIVIRVPVCKPLWQVLVGAPSPMERRDVVGRPRIGVVVARRPHDAATRSMTSAAA
jgi:hypothetical protein